MKVGDEVQWWVRGKQHTGTLKELNGFTIHVEEQIEGVPVISVICLVH